MPWTYTDEYYTDYTRSTWNQAAEPYIALMGRFAPIHQELVRLTRPKRGETILDLACGPGEPAMSLARRVRPTGRVVGVDLARKMLQMARRSARQQGLENLSFREMNCEKLRLPRASFDGATSAFGFQIFTNPEQAAAETHRVVKPGGRLACCIWSTGDRVPFLDAIIGPMLAHAEPDENGYIPTPYEIGGKGEMVQFLTKSGFHDATETRVTFDFHLRDADEYFAVILKGTPIGHSLSEENTRVQREVLRDTRVNLRAWTNPDGISIPGECVFVTARR